VPDRSLGEDDACGVGEVEEGVGLGEEGAHEASVVAGKGGMAAMDEAVGVATRCAAFVLDFVLGGRMRFTCAGPAGFRAFEG
jgi:hypothetical protein